MNRDRLNATILKHADSLPSGWHAADIAPDTFAGLVSSTRNAGGHITVWAGGSERTLYGDAHVNHAMRAWHDSLHVGLVSDFTLAGETRVATAQAALVHPDDAPLLVADVLGQAEYYAQHKAFPEDQLAFVAAYLADRNAALGRTF